MHLADPVSAGNLRLNEMCSIVCILCVCINPFVSLGKEEATRVVVMSETLVGLVSLPLSAE